MKDSAKTVYLKDYRQPDFLIPETALHFFLEEDLTTVRSKLQIRRQSGEANTPLVLMGEKLNLKSVSIDGRKLSQAEFKATDSFLEIPSVPDQFELSVEVTVKPQDNLSCEGLYKSSGMFCTQCEAESFRRITYFLDRPDVMSVYTVTIEASKKKYPILLSNGNRISGHDLTSSGREGYHSVTWHDPFKKPCYLFALVAGDLGVLKSTFQTKSGRNIDLQIYAREGLQSRCQHAMDSLKWSLRWDEETYGLEYDLDTFMIVVAEDFNMGAMENKGLNIFNANYVLAEPQTATDSDFEKVSAVVAHEYFHNWTGNRVTCRDWFQLSLKEGLTVFRDQRFSADLGSSAVRRIEEVMKLRSEQFSEDAGPMAHPIRPQSYISIDNFYTRTVYEKGAEVIRMIETLVGRQGFRKGMDLYFKRFDGQAVTTEDFVSAMADANHIDLTQFKNWYDQAGTPLLKVTTSYDAKAQTFEIHFNQSCAPSPGQESKKPYHIPVAIGLLDAKGRDLPLDSQSATTRVLDVREPSQSFTFSGIKEKPVLSLLRGFSAPVKTEFEISDQDLAFLMAHDSDAFARWEAAQTFMIRTIRGVVSNLQNGQPPASCESLVRAFQSLVEDAEIDANFTALMLTLPDEQTLGQFFSVFDIDSVHTAREHVIGEIAKHYKQSLHVLYSKLVASSNEKLDAESVGRRALKNRILTYLTHTDETADLAIAAGQARAAKNMTDELGALAALNPSSSKICKEAFAQFYEKWKDEPLVINKWLTVQANSPSENVLQQIEDLSRGPAFDKTNPNKIYALYLSFARHNLVRFHNKNGQAYRFIADQVMDIDSRNPQVASRLVSTFNQWRQYDSDRQKLMQTELRRVLAKPGLSSNVFEIVSKALGN